MPENLEARASGPQNERAHARSHLSLFGPLPHLSPDRQGAGSSLPKEPGGGAGGMAEDAEEIPGWSMFSVGAREKLKTRGGSLSSEGANAAVQTERSTPIKFFRSLQ